MNMDIDEYRSIVYGPNSNSKEWDEKKIVKSTIDVHMSKTKKKKEKELYSKS